MKTFILILLLSITATAQTFIGGGVTTSSNRDFHVGGVYVEGGAKLASGSLGELHAYGLLFHDSFGNRGQNVTGPAKPGFRANVRFFPSFQSPAWRPFVDAGITTLRLTTDATHWPTAGGGVEFFGKIAPRVHYLLGDGAGRPHAWRYGADLTYKIGDSPFAVRILVDGTKARGLATVFEVRGGAAYTFK